jgi:hypothetical protein
MNVPVQWNSIPEWQRQVATVVNRLIYLTQTKTTVTKLPAAADIGAGARAFVTDATATTFASAVVGGGSNNVPVYCDGTIWRIG